MNYEEIMKLHKEVGKHGGSVHLTPDKDISIEVNHLSEIIVKDETCNDVIAMHKPEAIALRDALIKLFPLEVTK